MSFHDVSWRAMSRDVELCRCLPHAVRRRFVQVSRGMRRRTGGNLLPFEKSSRREGGLFFAKQPRIMRR